MKLMKMIMCVDKNWGLSKGGSVPWKIQNGYFLNFLKKQTAHGQNILIMGRKTYESIPLDVFNDCRKPYVLTTIEDYNVMDGKSFVNITNAITYAKLEIENQENIWILGGKQIYEQCYDLKIIQEVFVTHLFENYDCDEQISPLYLNDFDKSLVESHFDCKIYKYSTKQNNEEQYLSLMRTVLLEGVLSNDRTNVGTLRIFGKSLHFNISDSFPLLTTKKVFYRGVFEELIWFLKGDTNVNHLIKKDVFIWNGNSSREYMDSINISREERDIGPCYGWQWRHFGAKYKTMHDEYSNCGVDQIKYIIEEIQRNPSSRRLLMSAWNPCDLHEMNLPPCHVLYQFFVEDDYISCNMYQRSADVFLGLPFNIASSGLLVYIIANICNLKPKHLNIFLGDVHVYRNHIENCLIQLSREPKNECKLQIKRKLTFDDLMNLTIDDFSLNNYESHPGIKGDMAV